MRDGKGGLGRDFYPCGVLGLTKIRDEMIVHLVDASQQTLETPTC